MNPEQFSYTVKHGWVFGIVEVTNETQQTEIPFTEPMNDNEATQYAKNIIQRVDSLDEIPT